MKRPSFQFYPADWRKDPALSACSMAARGLWIELMCIAHESDNYGHLSINGKPMVTAQIARMVGESPNVVSKLLGELDDAGVFSRDEQGSIFSRRMVNDERIRNVRADAGRLGGNPNLLKQNIKQEVKQNEEQILTPSSSSSSSSSNNTPKAPKGAGLRFEEFWTAWPNGERKQDRKKCSEKWRAGNLDSLAEAILADIGIKRSTDKWREGYIEAPLVYLNNRRWEDGVRPGLAGADDWTREAT